LIAQNPSWENTAREARYRFLVKIARQVKAPVIAVGHTLDDQSETVLMHLIRGCGFRGLSGILPKREVLPDTAIKLIRPLLNLTRPELLRFLKSQKQAYRIDATNLSPHTGLRNRVRLKLLPALAQYNPRIKKHLCQLGLMAHEIYRYLEKITRRYCPRQQDFIRLKTFKRIPPVFRIPVLDKLLKNTGGNPQELTSEHYQAICALALATVDKRLPSNKAIRYLDLPGNIKARIDAQSLRFIKAPPASSSARIIKPGVINIPGKTYLPQYHLTVTTQKLNSRKGLLGQFSRTKTAYAELFDWAQLTLPLKIRYRLAGDKFIPLGVSGQQSLKKFFINHKIPRAQRASIPLVTSGNRVIWVVGYRMSERVKINSQTKQLLMIKVHK